MKLFQNLVQQITGIIDTRFGIIDQTGLILACSDEVSAGEQDPVVKDVVNCRENEFSNGKTTYQKVFIRGKLEFVTFIDSADEYGRQILSLISINVANIRTYHEEKFDRNNFIKNVLLDNILPGEIPFRSKELRIDYSSERVAFLIKTGKSRDVFLHEVIQSLFPNKSKDFIVILDDENTVLVKELKDDRSKANLEKTAKIILDTLTTESMVRAHIGIGTPVDNIPDIARSFKEAQTALLVGGIFESDRFIVSYDNLGLGRLIYQLPVTLCKLFLNEVFKERSFDSLDGETIHTIQKFFENNLNISETSRQLYVHRNTLVYRLDKIQKITGLDLRKFDDAIIFKVSMLVKKYLDKGRDLL
jgi:carbohydrate diacid regulator